MPYIKAIIKRIHKERFIFILVSLVVPFFLVISNLKIHGITLWFDPSRDLLAAWDSLTKPTLLGPPTGIPGLHYGPYWIWLLSFGLLFSKNPVYVTFITATLPYLIIFPFIWFQLSKYLNRTALVLGWLLFITGNGMLYATQLWNLYPAPLIMLALFVLLIKTDFSTKTKRTLFSSLLIGFLLALMINFHISFGITLILSTFIFLLIDTSIKSKLTILDRLQLLCLVLTGLIIGILPSIAFETRHSFLQTHILIHTFLRYGWVIGVVGLSKFAILNEYFKTFCNVLHIDNIFGAVVFVILLGGLIKQIIDKKSVDYKEMRIGILCLIVLFGSAFIYLTAKNPIWEYHFIGIDIVFLLFITFAVSKIPLFKKILVIWTIIAVLLTFYQLVENKMEKKPILQQQISVVKTINQDAHGSDYSIYAYSQSIYIYDYTYLFRWLVNKDIPYDPSMVKPNKIVYVIFLSNETSAIKDFLHNRTPEKTFYVAKTWHIDDITVIKNIRR